MKVGRNDSCSCGSGIKFKKCCINKITQLNSVGFHPQTVEQPDAEPFFSNYATSELLKAFAGLTLMPENYGKNFRLEELTTRSILSMNELGTPTSKEIQHFTEKEFPASYMEDPCVNLFTELVSFYGGDYLLLPGITETGEQILTNLLTAIYQWPETKLPHQYRTNIEHVAKLLLLISDIIATRAGLQRYQDGIEGDSLIIVPGDDKLEQLKAAVTFTEAEMQLLLKEHGIAQQALDLFVLDPSTLPADIFEIERNPILYKPIIHLNGEYIITSPASIGLALADFIWAEADRAGLVINLGEAYHYVIWNSLQLYLGQLGFQSADVNGSEKLYNKRSGYYTFDTDKIAYISYIADNGVGYDQNPEHAIKGSVSPVETENAITILKADKNFGQFHVLQLTLLSMIGRTVYFMHKAHEGIQTIVTGAFDIEALWRLQNVNAIDLWKFALTRERFTSHVLPSQFSVLDLLKFYKEQNDSFYYTDEVKDPMPPLNFGASKEWLVKAKTKVDAHAINYNTDHRIVPVPVQRKDTYAPIYLNLMDLAEQKLRFALEGFDQPVWVEANNLPSPLSKELKDIYWQLCDAIAYWLWQIQSQVNSFSKSLGNDPIIITFELDDPSKFEDIKRDFKREGQLDSFFKVDVTEFGFHILVPHQLIPYLYGADNEGERVLVTQLMYGFNQILAEKDLPLIPEERLEDILAKQAPLGMKKKFFILDSSDNMLIDPRHIKEHRYVQEYDVSKVLDTIVPALGNTCPTVGELETKEERQAFADKLATEVLLNMLREKLQLYNSTELLKILIGKHESLIHKREEIRIHTPTRIACFVSQERQQEDLEESMGKLSRTTVAIRGIIEHITAEPYYGDRPISTTAIDELIGIMDQIISWGSTSDHIFFNLFDTRIGILNSGRIGTDKKIHHEVFDPYHRSKASENVSDAIATFNQVFPQNNAVKGKQVPVNLDEAFIIDHGISFTRICQFIDGLAGIGFSQVRDYASVPLDLLRAEINKGTFVFEQEEFDRAIAFLSLTHRGNVTTIPEGYQDIDVQPWRFNRLLSLMRRPLIIVDDAGAKTAYWGARQVLASRIYLAEQCQMDRFRVLKNEKAVKKVLGEFAQMRGDALVKKVVDSIDPTDPIIATDQFIGPKNEHQFKHTTLIGDIDVLIIDPQRKRIASLECKAMAPSRNIREMVEESSKLFGGPEKKGWIDKHMERDSWLKSNLHQLTEKFGIDVGDYQVLSFFVTEEDMLTPYLREMDLPLPFLSSYVIQKEGYDAITKNFPAET